MKIVDRTPAFFNLSNHSEWSREFLEEHYYQLYPEIFSLYFSNHCPRTDERINSAIERYTDDMEQMKEVAAKLPGIIKKIMRDFKNYFGVELDLQFNIFVGAYGSNAFVEQKVIGQIYFAVEKLSPDSKHLEVIVAHEISHVYHNYLSDQAHLNWSEVEWGHGTNSLFYEGVATYISQQIVKEAEESIYFSYNDLGEEWLAYAKENQSLIASAFLKDVQSGWTFEQEREWFRLSGGSYFGYNRLGYYLGTAFLHDLVKEVGEEQAITYWTAGKIKDKVIAWLEQQKRVNDSVIMK